MKRKNANSIIYLIFLFSVILAFCAFAIDATIVYTTRSKLQNATEEAALAGASMFNSPVIVPATIEGIVEARAKNTFDHFKVRDLKYANIEVKVNKSIKEVSVKTDLISPTFFLSFLGVSTIKLNAQAAAVSETLDVKAQFPSVVWLSERALYLSSIIYSASDLSDTAILTPLGDFPSASIDGATGKVNFSLIEADGANPLSLGPGGTVLIRLSSPIVDKPGYDLLINEIGDALEGYFVFAGIDNSASGPYFNAGDAGGGIMWKNITCSGVSTVESTNVPNILRPYGIAVSGLAPQKKFYGSAKFDLGASCDGTPLGISMAKYIKIVDDNSESAFVKNSFNPASKVYYKAMLYGEASTPTAGADIDRVAVLNHVRLIKASAYHD